MRHALNTPTAAVGATLLVTLALAGCGDDSNQVSLIRPSSDAASPTPSATSSGGGPRSMEGVEGALEPGAWVVPLWAADYQSLPRAVVQVPPGYGSPGGWVVDRGADGDPEHHGDVSFWTIDTVVGDPCANRDDRQPGPTTEDLAGALRQASGDRVTGARRVTLDGRSAEYVEITLPGRHRLAGCTSAAYTLWRIEGDDGYRLDTPGTVVRLWILDVDGTRVVVDATTTPGETAADVAEVVGIARSAHFIAPPGTGAGAQ